MDQGDQRGIDHGRLRVGMCLFRMPRDTAAQQRKSSSQQGSQSDATKTAKPTQQSQTSQQSQPSKQSEVDGGVLEVTLAAPKNKERTAKQIPIR